VSELFGKYSRIFKHAWMCSIDNTRHECVGFGRIAKTLYVACEEKEGGRQSVSDAK
jgi:hypothetical protein